jgi:hypothetical protein
MHTGRKTEWALWHEAKTSTSHRFRAGAAQCAALIAPYGLVTPDQDSLGFK